MTAADRKAIVRAYAEALNEGAFDRAASLFAPDATTHGVLGAGPPSVVLPIWRELHASMSMRLDILALAAEGDSVVARFRETGRFVGPFRGLPNHVPTQLPYEIVASGSSSRAIAS